MSIENCCEQAVALCFFMSWKQTPNQRENTPIWNRFCPARSPENKSAISICGGFRNEKSRPIFLSQQKQSVTDITGMHVSHIKLWLLQALPPKECGKA